MITNVIKMFDAEKYDVEELVELSAYGRLLQAEFATLGGEEPEWLTAKLREIRREIKVRTQDRIERMLKEKQARLEAMKPKELRRAELEEQIKKLQEQLSTN